ncbi:MAG: hypothetical protein M9918_19530 [Anaerolineae bacterium]|nr:hypothetical protein [Anaerolineae bacterium]
MFISDSRGYLTYNPHNLPSDSLVVVYGFPNQFVPPNNFVGILMASDGSACGSHVSSDEEWLRHDLGVNNPASPKHHLLMATFPDGYRMDYVPYDEVEGHQGLDAAYEEHLAKHNRASD